MNTHTPKHFALQLGSIIALYVSITALLVLLFSLINLKFPDAAEYYYSSESARGAIRGAIATLVVFFPTYLALTRISNQTRRKETNGEYTTLGKWLVYLSLLGAGCVLLADLVTLILYFLNGEVTMRFFLKVAVLAAVVKLAGLYYLLDVRNYFKKRIMLGFYFAITISVLVIGALVYGFMNIETPAVVREMRLDDKQISDLQDMRWRIEEYYRSNETLPPDVAAVYTVSELPAAPENRENYRYEATGDTTYELCATFAQSSTQGADLHSLAAPIGMEKNFNWEYEAGEWCFEREIQGEYRM